MKTNGHQPDLPHCPLFVEWAKHKEQTLSAFAKLEALHDGMDEVIANTRHLAALTDIRDTLLSAATGRDHIPIKVFLVVLGSLGSVIVGLVFVIVFLLTGEAAGWINPLKG